MYKIFNKSIFKDRRKILRKSLTPQEFKLWFYLKSKNLGIKFRRQHSIGPYIVDFYCKEKNLVIELDGSQHLEAKEYDRERDSYLQTLGIKVIRFWNNEIDKNIEDVLIRIKEEITYTPLRRGASSPSQGRKI
jgi:very-short-patch-repair endonuclease